MRKSMREFREEHAISEELSGLERYVPFEKGDTDLVASYFEDFDPKLAKHGRMVAGQSGGVIIRRKGWGRHIPPQLRPDDPVVTNPARRWSFHPSDPELRFTRTKTRQGKWITVRALPEGARKRHIRKPFHGGVNVEHVHLDPPRAAKYLIPPGKDAAGVGYGKRLDVPLPDRILRADRVFFVLEGSLKTDAILSTDEAAFGVPSVTLWAAGGRDDGPFAPELDAFIDAMSLRDRQVVIVCDADWVANPNVVGQAMHCRSYLRGRGVPAIVAAPMLTEDELEILRLLPCSAENALPADVAGVAAALSLNGELVTGHLADIKAKKGVDDFLASGYLLDDLSVLHREPPDPVLVWSRLANEIRRSNQLLRCMHALGELSLHADLHGQLDKNLSAFARILGRGRNRVRDTLETLERVGVIEVEGSLSAGLQWPKRQPEHNYEWDERPRITIVPELRATEKFVPLCAGPSAGRTNITEPSREEAIHVESRAC